MAYGYGQKQTTVNRYDIQLPGQIKSIDASLLGIDGWRGDYYLGQSAHSAMLNQPFFAVSSYFEEVQLSLLEEFGD